MARNSTEQLVASTTRSRENPPFPAYGQYGVNTTRPSVYKKTKCGIMLVLNGVVFCLILCTVVHYLAVLVHTDILSDLRKRHAFCNPRVALSSQRVFFQGGLSPRNRAAVFEAGVRLGEGIIA